MSSVVPAVLFLAWFIRRAAQQPWSAFYSTKIPVWNFGNSASQWNGTFRLHRPNPSHRAFGYCSFKQDTKERYWRQQFCEMKRDVSVWPTEMTGPVTGHRFTGGPKHSGQTDPKLIRSIWFLMEIRLLNWMESACDHLENFQRGSRHHNTGIPGNRAGSVVM